ncbi:hypothetical protein HQ585_07710 [candidate division KSB1 bacterium]|nr:hypothetical protein [candidate division KSB1 bacterium]
MADCECLPQCPFFNNKMEGKTITVELMKSQYCRDDFESCARHMIYVKLDSEKVPAELFPNQVDRAKNILGAG